MSKPKIAFKKKIILMLAVTLLVLSSFSYLQAKNIISEETRFMFSQEVGQVLLEGNKIDQSNLLTKEKEFKTLPNKYRSLNEKQGTIETLVYNVANRGVVQMLRDYMSIFLMGITMKTMTRSTIFYI